MIRRYVSGRLENFTNYACELKNINYNLLRFYTLTTGIKHASRKCALILLPDVEYFSNFSPIK